MPLQNCPPGEALLEEKWEWGWNNSSEVWNGRLAIGFSAFLLELISGHGPLHALGLL